MSDAREGSRCFYEHRECDRREHAVERYLKLAELRRRARSVRRYVVRFPAATRCRVSMNIRRSSCFIPLRADGSKSLSNAVIEEFCLAFAPTRVVVVGQSHRQIDAAGKLCRAHEPNFAASAGLADSRRKFRRSVSTAARCISPPP